MTREQALLEAIADCSDGEMRVETDHVGKPWAINEPIVHCDDSNFGMTASELLSALQQRGFDVVKL